MSDASLTTTQHLTPRQAGAIDRSKPGKVTGRLKRALDMIVWDNVRDNEAAVIVGMNVLAIRSSLQRPHVLAYYKAQREVLRQRESPANIHTLIEVRDQTANQMARVNAVKALEQLDTESATGLGASRQAGIVIMIGAAPAVSAEIKQVVGQIVGSEPQLKSE